MLKNYIKDLCVNLLRLRTDKDGVVSLEYVVVAACVVAVVITAFGAGGSLPGALTTGFTAITTAMEIEFERGIASSVALELFMSTPSFETCV